MKLRKFCFTGYINGDRRELIVSVPVENGGVYTNKYCPQELLTGGINFIQATNGEIEEEFISDCNKQMAAMERVGVQETLLDVHIGGLMAIIMEHLARCNRMIFGDLLIYMDCFSLLLEADGFAEDEIRLIYPRVVRSIVDLYPDRVFNTFDLTPFKNSHFDLLLTNLLRE